MVAQNRQAEVISRIPYYVFDSGNLKALELGLSYYYASRAEATLPNTYGFRRMMCRRASFAVTASDS